MHHIHNPQHILYICPECAGSSAVFKSCQIISVDALSLNKYHNKNYQFSNILAINYQMLNWTFFSTIYMIILVFLLCNFFFNCLTFMLSHISLTAQKSYLLSQNTCYLIIFTWKQVLLFKYSGLDSTEKHFYARKIGQPQSWATCG